MSQHNINQRERATYVCEELTFGAGDTGGVAFPNQYMRCFPLGDDVILGDLQEEQLEVMDERVRRDANVPKVRGLKIASKIGPLKFNLKTVKTAAQLSASGTVTPMTARIICRHGFGAEYAAVGTTISGSGSTTTVINVTSAAAIKKGTFLLVEVSGELEWAKVIDVDTGATPDAVTLLDPLSGAPTTGSVVRQMYNYCRALACTKSLSFRQGFVGEATADHTVTGCFGDVVFDLPEPGKLATMTFSPTVTNYTLGSQSIGTATASDEMGAAFAWTPSVYLAATVARGTRLVNEGCTVEQVESTDLVRDPGATQTINSIVRVGGRPVAVKVGIKLRFDADHDTAYAAGTALRFVAVQKIGTGLTASFHLMEVPNARIVGQPKRVKIGERLHMELALEGYQDESVVLASETGEDLDRVLASSRYAFA